ncbi:MAG: bifunctional nuclease family protein [Chlorobiaceae bacterium]|nr:bifunctional nuclease family protein [Chlorobiaceae bacterium]
MHKLQVDILGLSTSPHTNGAYALILYEVDGKRKLPIIIGGFEAQAIALKLENIKPPRPFTHDLFKQIADVFDLHVNEVFIDELHNETFYAKVICEQGGVVHEIDARPSDAIAIAVRFNAPIFVSEEIMNEAGIVEEQQKEEAEPVQPEEVSGGTSPEAEVPGVVSTEADLKQKLEEAINREDYEEAARIRDELSRLSEDGGEED